MKEKILNTIRIIILSAIFSTAIGYSLADFQAPPCAPPCGNTPPPINVGSATQVRDGVLIINNQFGATKGNFGTADIGKASGIQPIYGTDPGNTLVRKDYVDGRINTISLTPGPAGPAGAPGPAGPPGAAGGNVFVHPITDYCGGTAFQCTGSSAPGLKWTGSFWAWPLSPTVPCDSAYGGGGYVLCTQ